MDHMDHFEVAATLSRLAMDHLGVAAGQYGVLRNAGAFDITKHDWQACLARSGSVSMSRRLELRHTMGAVVHFQAMMEKIPYVVPDLGGRCFMPPKESSFAGAWKDLLDQIKDTTAKVAATAAFRFYKKHVYDKCRNPIIHGKQDEDLKLIAKMRFPDVHEGFRNGWAAYDALLKVSFPDHQESWAILCETADHPVPATLVGADYPDLELLEVDFIKKHLAGAEAALTNSG